MANFEVGDLFADRYEIKKLIGRGGMGMVYLAQDWKRHRPVALKTLLPRYAANRQAVLRFGREVNAARRLDHPCIVKIYDARKHGDTLYYTMEYVEGRSVRRWIKSKRRLGLGSTVRVLSMVCHALEHAHQYTIHRDISPENVMVLPNGQVKLLDFGLAKIMDDDAGLTRVGVSLGKLQYCAPEQRTDAKNVDLRTDIYALGVMFYEMLTGALPKPGVTITQLVPELPKECDDFYKKATQDDPDDRYQTARDFRVALRELYERAKALGLDPLTPPPTEPATPTPPGAEQPAAPVVQAPAQPQNGFFGRAKLFFANLAGKVRGKT